MKVRKRRAQLFEKGHLTEISNFKEEFNRLDG